MARGLVTQVTTMVFYDRNYEAKLKLVRTRLLATSSDWHCDIVGTGVGAEYVVASKKIDNFIDKDGLG